MNLTGALLLFTLTLAASDPIVLDSGNAQPLGSFGFQLATTPDLDGDGHSDVVTGAVNESLPGDPGNTGLAYLHSGATGDLLHVLRSPDPEAQGRFARTAAALPDIDGDGFGDAVIGAFNEDVGGVTNAGRVHLYSGRTGALLRTLISPTPDANGYFGRSCVGLPDINGDGRGEVVVGAMFDPVPGAPDAGKAYIFSGSDGVLLQTLVPGNPEPDRQGGAFGHSLAAVPDSTGDGYGEVIVGAHFEDPGPDAFLQEGRAYLYSSIDGTLLHEFQSPNPEELGLFARVVSGVEDLDGDGRGDVIISGYNETVDGRPSAGRAYVFSGADGSLIRTLVSPNSEADGIFGRFVGGAADMDGDGLGEVLIGAQQETVNGLSMAGRAYLFSGGNGRLLRQYESPFPEENGNFGFCVHGSTFAGTTDTDGDGETNILIGAYNETVAGATGAGRAYLYDSPPPPPLHSHLQVH